MNSLQSVREKTGCPAKTRQTARHYHAHSNHSKLFRCTSHGRGFVIVMLKTAGNCWKTVTPQQPQGHF